MKIYTRTGDDGTTGLFGGPRVPKTHLRISSYGTVDELNSILGLARADLISTGPDGNDRSEGLSVLDGELERIQKELFMLGADLATPLDSKARVARVSEAQIEALEAGIDRMTGQLAPLERFILPGGSRAAAQLHVARTVCRRAERLVVELSAGTDISALAVTYLNRLSDYLFTAARAANAALGIGDVEWLPEGP
ncbi:MAG: ATP:cob(I)alamin adenosyltransferase [Bacteroidetes bacterium CG12_big_fil_rev_8_21_14_0_65_60_17]|nr:MAG: ATP:cob(I)alamin adenosyltransferase [Bacteroidetes bacterium CG12_big_fil_rev_8_21_14_0_65_60_17]